MGSTLLTTNYNAEWSVLLVEGLELVAKGLCRTLEKVTPKIDWAENARAAQILLNRNEYQLMLLDLWLPDMDGLELAKRIRQHFRWDSMRIIALTTNKNETQFAPIREAGLKGVLKKPVTPELYQALLPWLSSKESEGGFFTG